MIARPPLQAGQSIGVTLSGGGTRLYAHLGVLRAIEAAGLRPTQVAGVSGGAIVAAAYAALGVEKAQELLRGFAIERALRFGWLRKLGWYDNRDVATLARDAGITWEAVKARGIDLQIGVTALEPGLGLVWTCDDHPVDLAEAMRISATIPLLWGYTRMPTDQLKLPRLPAGAVLPPEITLVDGGIACMLLPGGELPWVASNIAFNGYRDMPIGGLVDYLAQILSTMQYKLMLPALTGASCVVKHRAFRSSGWLDKVTPAGVDVIVESARVEAAAELAQSMALSP